MQRAWIRAAERLESFRWESSLRTWLCGFVVNAWRESLREGKRSVFAEIPSEDFAPGSVEGRLDLERCIERLPDGFRAVLLLHDVEGFTHGQIGRLLEIESGTSKSQLARARRALRRMLG